MKLRILVVAVAAIVIAAPIIWFANATQPIRKTYPQPNAYDTVERAGEAMKPLPKDYDTSQDTDALQRYVDSNGQSFRLTRRALSQDYVVPLGRFDSFDEAIDEVGSVRAIARLLFVKARLDQLEDRSGEAAQTLTDSVVLGHRSGNGGLIVHQLVASACQRQAMEALMQLAPQLPADLRSRLAQRIQAEFRNEPSIDDAIEQILNREHVMAKRHHGAVMGMFMVWMTSGTGDIGDQLRKAMRATRSDRQKLLQLLTSSVP